MVEILIHDPDTGQTRIERHASSPVRIGRNPHNEVCLEFGFISGWHARVEFDELGESFTDLGSTNGSIVAGRRLEPHQAVAVGDDLQVMLGRLELRIRPEPVRSIETLAESSVSARREGVEATGFVDLSGVHRAIRELRPSYAEFVVARDQLQRAIDEAVAELPLNTRDTALAFIRREFPSLPSARINADPIPPSADPVSVSRQLAAALLDRVDPPDSPTDEAEFLTRITDVLHTTARAFVELRNVQARFGEEMGVRTIREQTPLQSALDARAVLDYLLDWRPRGLEPSQQLAAVYSDFMVHQVALVNGLVDGAVALVEQLRPTEIERGLGGLNKAANAWKRYSERYTAIIDERGVAALVFGPEFARAYTRIGNNG